MPNRSIPLCVKVQALTLTELAGFSNLQAAEALQKGISERQIARIRSTAIERGWNPQTNPCLAEEYLVDKPRSGRPKKHNEV